MHAFWRVRPAPPAIAPTQQDMSVCADFFQTTATTFRDICLGEIDNVKE
jgi:hypothetical protein